MAYLALYRAFRPDTLDGVVRQEHIVKILRNQIAQDKVGHAYLFCGPRGTGKTSIAKIFARSINCTSPKNGSPCGECPTCKAFLNGNSLDIVEIDAASNNGVDEMRDLREKVQYPPVNGKYKVYIIDEVHMLSPGAFNALLKTLEEPPKHAVFILATTESQKIPATILSRCMRFDFKLIPQEDLENHLKNVLAKIGKEYEEEAVAAIARAGAGSVRDMLSIADICVSYDSGKLTYEAVGAVLGSADFALMDRLCYAMLSGNMPTAMTITEKLLAEGKGIGILVRDILTYLGNCSIAKTCRDANRILCLPKENYDRIKEVADSVDGHRILRTSEIFADCETKLRYSTSAHILLETAVMKASMPQTDYDIESLIARVSALENRLNNGETAPYIPPVSAPIAEKTEAEERYEEKEVVEEEFPPLPDEEPVFDYVPEPPKPVEVEVKAPVKEVEKPVAPVVSAVGSGSVDKSKAFGMFLRALRKISRSGVLFTLCSELNASFEGEKMVLDTTSESIVKSLTREEHLKVIAEAVSSVGVADFEIRLRGNKSDAFKEGVEKIKKDFAGIPVEVKI